VYLAAAASDKKGNQRATNFVDFHSPADILNSWSLHELEEIPSGKAPTFP